MIESQFPKFYTGKKSTDDECKLLDLSIVLIGLHQLLAAFVRF